MISTKIIPESDDSVAFDSILQIGHRFVGIREWNENGMGISKYFKVRVPKHRFDERYKKTK